ncbi:MAG: hypothetical protein QM783_00630 [Phycisphaerales bacterium]
MERLGGGRVVARPISPVAAVGFLLLALVIIALMIVFAVVAIPLAIIAGLGYAGYRALTGAARRKTNELLNRDDAGRKNVRVTRSASSEDTTFVDGSSSQP